MRKTKTSKSVYVPLAQKIGASTHVEVSVHYEKGGLSYFTYKNVPRGFFALVKPVEINGNAVSFMVFDNQAGKKLIAPAQRFSAKTLDAFAAAALSKAQDAAALVAEGQVKAALDLLVGAAQEAA